MKTLMKLSWVELKLFFREPITIVFTLALPLLMLYVLGGVSQYLGRWLLPRCWSHELLYRRVYRSCHRLYRVISLPVHVTAYRERGVLRRMHASNLHIWSVLGSRWP
jgi:ABC-2 type transport system permease protein